MNLSSLHTHTSFCDGRGEVEDFCRRAWEKGLHSLGFSAHAPLSPKTGLVSDWNLPEERLEDYLGAVREARERWAGRLRIYLGLEADYIAGLTGPLDGEYRLLGLDYLIGSVHYLVPPRGRPFTVDGSPEEFAEGVRLGYGGDGEAAMAAYWDAVEGMIRAGGFEILGHLDLIKKNNHGGRWFKPQGELYRERLTRIAALSAGGEGPVVELNTGGLNRGRTTETYPSVPLLRLLLERGVPVIVTADAHQPGDLDGHYPEALAALREAGYRESLLFEGRENGRPRWSSLPLERPGACAPC
jgi:histidinol-phosphatase (PHP family)